MDLRRLIKLSGLAVLGLVVAAIIGLLSNAVTSDSDGLSARPTTPGASLAPSDARTRAGGPGGATAPPFGLGRSRRDD